MSSEWYLAKEIATMTEDERDAAFGVKSLSGLFSMDPNFVKQRLDTYKSKQEVKE